MDVLNLIVIIRDMMLITLYCMGYTCYKLVLFNPYIISNYCNHSIRMLLEPIPYIISNYCNHSIRMLLEPIPLL
jgi:hypothetical protein